MVRKSRIYDLARELKQDAKRVMEDLRREGADVSVPSNSVSVEIAEKVRLRYFPKAEVAPKRGDQGHKSDEKRRSRTARTIGEAAPAEEVAAEPVAAEPMVEPVVEVSVAGRRTNSGEAKSRERESSRKKPLPKSRRKRGGGRNARAYGRSGDTGAKRNCPRPKAVNGVAPETVEAGSPKTTG